MKVELIAIPPVLLDEPPPPPPGKPWYDPLDLAPPEDELRVEHVMRAAANHFGVRMYELKQRRRQTAIVWRRHVAMYLCRELTTRTFLQIAPLFGIHDHTSVMHACRRIEKDFKDHPDVVTIRNRIRLDIATAVDIREIQAAEAAAIAAEDPNQLKLALEGGVA